MFGYIFVISALLKETSLELQCSNNQIQTFSIHKNII